MNVERVLREYGQFLRPMNEAPRDGRQVLGKSTKGLVVCYWDANPSKLAGPSWVVHEDAERGYLDKYFTGWLDLRSFKMLDYAALGSTKPSKLLELQARRFATTISCIPGKTRCLKRWRRAGAGARA